MYLPKAILFDLDDTLISFDGVSDITWEKICKQFIAEFSPDFDYKTLHSTLNKTRKWYWSDPERSKAGRSDMIKARRDVLGITLKELGIPDEPIANKTADMYSKLHNEALHLFDGVLDALNAIRSMNIKMAVITNGTSEGQREKLMRFGLTDYFEFVLIDTEVGYSKPDVRIFEMALNKLSMPAYDVWTVGDNLVWDIEGPQKLGIYSIWNDYRKNGLPTNSTIIPDKIINSVYELAEELKGY